MVKAIQQKLSESKTARWSVLALVSFTMMCAYFISDIMSPLKTLLEKEIADGGLGWTSMDFGVFNFSYGWFTVFLFMLIIGGIILDKWGTKFTGVLATGLMLVGPASEPRVQTPVVCARHHRIPAQSLLRYREVPPDKKRQFLSAWYSCRQSHPPSHHLMP